MKPTDEQISAYLDGEMPDADARAFEAALESDPEVQAALEHFLATDETLKAAFPQEALPEGYLERMGLGVEEQPSNVVSLAAHRERKSALARWRWPAVGALAASIAAALMVTAPWQASAPAGLAGSAAFQTAMNSAASAQARPLEDGRTATPVLTFKDGAGRYCREYNISGPKDGLSGIACRDDGRWAVEAEVKTGPSSAPEPGFQMAAGADTQPLDATYSRLKASDPLGANAETALIAQGWK